MGIPGLWDVLRPASKTMSLTQLSVVDGFEKNHGGHRGFRVGIDASIWFFHASSSFTNKPDVGENPELRTLFFRCAKLMNLPFLPLFVFDGPKRPSCKRGRRVGKRDSWLVNGLKQIIKAFGYEFICAPGEAEAELAYLNRIGVIDAVLTDDVDTFLFGGLMIIRNPSNLLSGNRANPVKNAEGRDDKNHVLTFTSADLESHSDVGLTQNGLILIGLLRGGDYHQEGVPGVGPSIAHGLARCGFGDSLIEAVQTKSAADLQDFLVQWRQEIRAELRTNRRGFIGRKNKKLADALPDSFPDLEILRAYGEPVISATFDKFTDVKWGEPDLSALAGLCELYFEWGYKEAILKRFRTVIWPGAVCRILRRSVLLADELAEAAERRRPAGVDATPTKRRPIVPQGTPSTMIARHFSRLEINSPHVNRLGGPDERPLIVKIHSERHHVSTDKLKEYRLEISPLQLATLAEQGISGKRPAIEGNPWSEDGDDDDEDGEPKKKSRAPKPPPDPETTLRMWMPAAMVDLVEPRIVAEFEEVQERKRQKKEGKGSRGPKSQVDPTSPKPARKKADSSPPKSPRKRAAAKAAPPAPAAALSGASYKDRLAFLVDSDGDLASDDDVELFRPSKLAPKISSKSSVSVTGTTRTASTSRTSVASTISQPPPAPSDPFFSDDESIPVARKPTAKSQARKASAAAKASQNTAAKRSQPRDEPSHSDHSDSELFLEPRKLPKSGATSRAQLAGRGTKRLERAPTPVGDHSDTHSAVHKSPRKNRLQESPRRAHPGHSRHHHDEDSDYGDLPPLTSRPTLTRNIPSAPAAFPMAVPVKAPKAPAKAKTVPAQLDDIIIILSTDEEDNCKPARKPQRRAAAAPPRTLSPDIIDLT